MNGEDGGGEQSAVDGFRRVQQPSLVELVVEDLRQAILTGTLEPGERISDARVAAAMGISRAPVREALRHLAARGLVVEEPRRGVFVARLSPDTAHNIYDCRRALEGLAAHRLAGMADVSYRVKPLSLIVAEMGRLEDAMARAEADHRFHLTLCNAVGNDWLKRLYAQIADQSWLIQARDSQAHARANDYDLVSMHQPIIAAIESRDPEQAERAVVAHIDLSEQRFITDLEVVSA